MTQDILTSDYVFMVAKGAILLLLIFYAIFSLIIIRQVDLMNKTLMTSISGLLKTVSIVHTGFAIGLIFLAWGIL